MKPIDAGPAVSATSALSAKEREDLLRIARLRERVSKHQVDVLGTQLLADLETQRDSYYSFDSDLEESPRDSR